jgi:hypothetical protein
MACIHLGHDKDQWQTLVKMIISSGFCKTENFLLWSYGMCQVTLKMGAAGSSKTSVLIY